MTGSVAFLVVAVLASVVGSFVLWLRHRQPTTFTSSIDEFQREMQALAREPSAPDARRRRGARPTPIVTVARDPELGRKLRSARLRSDGRPGKG